MTKLRLDQCNRIMFQDSLRSAVYRSLTKPVADGCEDASQTDACRADTQSKTSNSCEPKNLQHTQGKGRRESEEGTNTMRRGDKREAQLSRVSRGACELTQMTDSLSKFPNLNGQSKHFARDLLRGSPDLEESLAMLSKIQEGSRRFGLQEPRFSVDGCSSMPHMKYRKRSQFVGEEFDASERMSFRRFGYQEPRHSIDGSLRSSVEQMQRMSASMFKSKQRSDLLKEEIGGDEKSRYSFDGSSRTEELKRMSQVKFKQSSRLTEEEIGVQEMIGYKRFGQQEPRFSTGGSSRDSIGQLRRVIKESLFQQNLLSRSPEDERTCRSNRYEKFNYTSSVSATPQPKKAKGPNLIAKLMGLEEVTLQKVEPVKHEVKKKASNVLRLAIDNDRPKAMKLQLVEMKKKASLKQKSLQEIIEAMQLKGLLKGTQVDVPRIKPHPLDEMRLENFSRNFDMDDESPPIVIMKPLYLPQWERAVGKKNLLLDKFSGNEEIKSANLTKEEKVSDQERILSKSLDREEVKSIEKARMDSSTVSQKQQRQEAFKIRKKADERQKPLLDVKIEEEKRHGKAKRMPISQTNTTSSPPPKSDRRLYRTKNKVFPVKPQPKNSANSVKEKKTPRAKSDGKSTDIKSNEKNHKDGKESIDLHKMDRLSKSASLPAEKIPQETEKEAKTCNKANGRENQEPSVVVMPKISQARKGPEITKEVIHLPDKKPVTTKTAVVEDDLMCLLLGSRSFLTQAHELYGIDAHQRIHQSIKGVEEDVLKNAKLYVACGEEIMERKRHQHELLLYPILQTQMWDRTASFTLPQLAEEISSKLRILTSCIKVGRNNITSDDILYLRLERDIRCKDKLVNAMWDIGWITSGYPEEVGEVVCEVEESILSLLISEVATELVC